MASKIKIIVGIFIILIGFPIFIGGSAILLITPIFTDSQGYFMSQKFHVDRDGVAAIRLDIPLEDVEIDAPIEPSRLVTVKLETHGETASEKVFVGLTEKDEVDKVLTSNVSYIQITNLEFSSEWGLDDGKKNPMELVPVENTSSFDIPQIDAVTWIAGTGDTFNRFIWSPKKSELGGDLTLVLMNADLGASNSVDITFSVGAKIPIINVIGWIFLVFGGLFTLLGVILLWSGLRTKKPRADRVRYYQGAPTARVDAVARPAPKFHLQCSNCGSLNEPDSTFCSKCGEVLLSEDRKTVDDVVKEKQVEIYEPTGDKLVVAEGWPRFWAWLIDFFIVGAITSSLSSLIFLVLGDWSLWEFGVWNPSQWLVSLGPSTLIFFVYCILMEYNYGQTLGKMVLNLEIVSERTGDRPTMGEIAISALGKSFFLPLDVILGWIAKDENQIPNLEQRLTQKWARTVVIQQQKKKEESALFVSGRV